MKRMRSILAARPALIGAGALGCIAIVAFLRRGTSEANDNHDDRPVSTALATTTAATGAGPLTLAYRGDRGTLYDVDWHVRTTVPVPGLPAQSTDVELAGVTQVTDLGPSGARRLVGVRLVSLRSANFTALGKPLYADATAAQKDLVGQPVILAMGADGAVEDVYLDRATTPLAKNVLMALALHYGVTVPGPSTATSAYVATEPSDFGSVPWSYTRADGRLVKTTEQDEGKGRGEVRFDGSLPVDITMDLAVSPPVADTAEGPAAAQGSASFHAALQANPPAPGDAWPMPDVAKLERHAPDARPSLLDERASNLAVANGLTAGDLQFMVGAIARGQKPRKGALTRAAGFMRANPESCDALVSQFSAQTPLGRELILDLLSSSGDAKAQSAMRTVLAMPAAHTDPVLYQHMLQRFAFVDAPNAESVAFVAKEWESAKKAKDDDLRQAAAYTLGSLAFHASQSNHDAMARSILGSLLHDLNATRDADEERGLVASLGNTGMEGAKAPVLARAASKDVQMRSQAATSLRKFNDAEVRARLVALACDDDLEVAQAALRSLDTQSVGEPELSALAERAERGTMNTAVDPALITFVASRVKYRDPALRILKAVGARVGDRRELKDQVDRALAAMSDAPPGTVPVFPSRSGQPAR